MAPKTYTHLTLAARPTGHVTDDTFRCERLPFPPRSLKENEALVKVEYLSMEPAMRAWLDDVPSYLPPGVSWTGCILMI